MEDFVSGFSAAGISLYTIAPQFYKPEVMPGLMYKNALAALHMDA